MKLAALVEQFAEALVSRGVSVARAEETPWLDPFLAALPARLPRSYEAFVTGFRFGGFELAQIDFHSNLGDGSETDLVIAALRDPGLAEVCLGSSLVPVGRPADGSYNPICFDLREGGREAPLVRVDHEEALIRFRATVRSEIAPSFLHLIKETIAS